MSRARLFIENFFIYGIGNVLTRMVPFLMLPILTRIITNPEIFGVFDIYTIFIRFGIPLTVLGTYDAMFRLYFDHDDSVFQQEICSSSLAIVTTTSLFSLMIAFLLWSTGSFWGKNEYPWMILTAGAVIFSQAIKTIVAAPTRMQNKRKTIILLSLLGPILYYIIALTLARKHLPLEGLVLGNLISGLALLFLYSVLNHSFFSFSKIKKEYVWELLKIGAPLAPTFLIYWIFTSCDRFMIGHMINVEAVGLYGVGARLSAISQGIYVAFAGGWQYFAFSTMKDKDHAELMSRVFEILGIISILSLVVLLPWVNWIFKIMVAESYRTASVVFPYLYISPLLLMLSQIAGTQLQVLKKTYISTIFRSLGAFANVGLNFLLIPKLGILGAAIATFLGYWIMTVSLVSAVIHMKRLTIKREFLFFALLGTGFILCLPYMNLSWQSTFLTSTTFSLLIFSAYTSKIKLFLTKYRRPSR